MVSMKGIYADKPVLQQLAVLIFLILIGMVTTSFLSAYVQVWIAGGNSAILQTPGAIRWVQLATSLGSFLFPAWAMAYLCSTDVRSYLSIGKLPELKIWGYLVIGYFLLSPSINLLQCLNQQLVLPEFMEPIERWMREKEESAEGLTRVLLSANDWLSIIYNLLVIAVVAGITEEFLFRGALQRIIERWRISPHAVIWITATLFSAFHLQFYGFLPRMILGAYFGYLLLWGRNIWVPVIAHAIHNGVVVIGMSDSRLRETEFFNGEYTSDQLLPFALGTAISLLFLFPLLKRIMKELSKE